MIKYLKDFKELKGDKPRLSHINYRNICQVPLFQPQGQNSPFVFTVMQDEVTTQGLTYQIAVFRCYLRGECDAAFYINMNDLQTLNWIERNHCNSEHNEDRIYE